MEKSLLQGIHVSRFVAGSITLIIMIVVILGCDSGPFKNSTKYHTEDEVAEFLKKQYFEVPVESLKVDDFEYTLLDGTKEQLSQNKGKLIFLNFWATWCYPCRKEMPDMQTVMEELAGEPFRILAVNYGDERRKIERYIEKYPYTFDIIIDIDKSISTQLGIKGLPTTLIIDKNGKLLGRLIGPANWKKDEFLEFFKILSRKVT